MTKYKKMEEMFYHSRPEELSEYGIIDLAVRQDESKAVALWLGEDADFPMLSVLEIDASKQYLPDLDLMDMPVCQVAWPNNDDVIYVSDYLNGTVAYELCDDGQRNLGIIPIDEGGFVWAFEPVSLPEFKWRRYREFSPGKFEYIDHNDVSYSAGDITHDLRRYVKSQGYIIYPIVDVDEAFEVVDSSFKSFYDLAEQYAMPNPNDGDEVWISRFGKPRHEMTTEEIEKIPLRVKWYLDKADAYTASTRKKFERLLKTSVPLPESGKSVRGIVNSIKRYTHTLDIS